MQPNSSNQRTIVSHFSHDGFAFHLLDRVRDVALFKKSKHGRDFYEVVIVQELPAGTIFGRSYHAREAMPPSEAWGIHGWSLTTTERAQEKFAELVRAHHGCPFSPGRTAVDAFLGVQGVLVANTGPEPVPADTSIAS